MQTWVVETGGSGVQGRLGLHKFEATQNLASKDNIKSPELFLRGFILNVCICMRVVRTHPVYHGG